MRGVDYGWVSRQRGVLRQALLENERVKKQCSGIGFLATHGIRLL